MPSVTKWVWYRDMRVLIGLVLVAVLVGTPFQYRAYRISRIPIVPDPVDIDAVVNRNVPEADNAASEYRRALAELEKLPKPLQSELDVVGDFGWERATPGVREYLSRCESVLVIWREAAQRPTFYSRDSYPPVRPPFLAARLRGLLRVAMLSAVRRLGEGDVDAAWHELHAVYRMSHQVGSQGPLVEELMSSAFEATADEVALKWCEHFAVDSDRLRGALRDYRAGIAQRVARSVLYRAEFASMTLDERIFEGHNSVWERWRLYFEGEPEVTRRLLRLAFANYLSVCDDASSLHETLTPWWELHTSAKATVHGFTGEQVESLALSTRIRPWAGTRHAITLHFKRRMVRQVRIEMAIVLALFRHLHNRFPEGWQELVDEKLITEQPRDPFAPTQPLGYRNEGDAAWFWTVGDQGSYHGTREYNEPGNLAIELFAPGKRPADSSPNGRR